MHPTPSTWLLLDDQVRRRVQVMGVAERLTWPTTAKEIRYNNLASLAGIVPGSVLWHLAPASRAGICPPWPDLVIGAGRRAAPVMLAIKRRSPATKLVHLMWPGTASGFDLIALPESGGIQRSNANIMRTLGVAHGVTPAKLAQEAAHWHPAVARLPRPRIALLIGGNGRHAQYEDADFKALGAYAAAEAERLGGSLLITSSPRTGEKAEDLVKSPLTAPHIFHRWHPEKDNPFMAFLGLADAIIVTGDSTPMCSQACATGKPVYVFVPPHSDLGKKDFCDALFTRGYAKPHTYPIRPEWLPAPFPDAAAEVAAAIQARLFHHIPVDPVAAQA